MLRSFEGFKEKLGFVKKAGAYRRAVERELSSLTSINFGSLLASDSFASTCENGRKQGMLPGEVACWISLCLVNDRLIRTSP
jgi:hypothetical protein